MYYTKPCYQGWEPRTHNVSPFKKGSILKRQHGQSRVLTSHCILILLPFDQYLFVTGSRPLIPAHNVFYFLNIKCYTVGEQEGRAGSAWKPGRWGDRGERVGGRGERWPKQCIHIWINIKTIFKIIYIKTYKYMFIMLQLQKKCVKLSKCFPTTLSPVVTFTS
jgi:hypothetical protein